MMESHIISITQNPPRVRDKREHDESRFNTKILIFLEKVRKQEIHSSHHKLKRNSIYNVENKLTFNFQTKLAAQVLC